MTENTLNNEEQGKEFNSESVENVDIEAPKTAEEQKEVTEHIEQLEMVSEAANQAVDELTKNQSPKKMSTDQIEHVKGVIEALLFVNEKPITIEQIRKALPTVSPAEIKKLIAVLTDELMVRKGGMTIVEIAEGYQMLSNPLYASYVRSFYQTKHKEKLSKPALETLAIIAYKQPVSRAEIEQIRGVNTDGVFVHLLNKELIKVVGRKEVPGRPFIYGTTKEFLEYFGLKSLESLPKLEELVVLEEKVQEKNMNITLEEAAAKNENAPATVNIPLEEKAAESASSPIVEKAEQFIEEAKEA